MNSLQNLSYNEIQSLTAELGLPKFRADQIYDIVTKNKSYDEVTNLPKAVLDALKTRFAAKSVELYKEFKGKGGAKKYLYLLNDNNIIEGIYMPHGYGDTLCVSTQIGCRMNCSFCASGIGGLVRNLTAGEILGQVLLANRLNEKGDSRAAKPQAVCKGEDSIATQPAKEARKRAVTNVVLMGSGEPLDNFDNIVKFFELVSYEKGINISLRNISLSTVGIPKKIKELADKGYPVTLSISLHAPTDAKRNLLIPLNLKYNIAEVIAAAKYYFDKTGRRIIFEYALAKDQNSCKQSAQELSKLLKGIPCHVNLIELNYVKEKNIKPADRKTINEFEQTLKQNKISVTIRRSAGTDIDGACGQLRSKYVEN
jgi:23S rRNA (adenine2503-C2)-methyltransferase